MVVCRHQKKKLQKPSGDGSFWQTRAAASGRGKFDAAYRSMEHNKIVTSVVLLRYASNEAGLFRFIAITTRNILPLLLIGAELSGCDGSFHAP